MNKKIIYLPVPEGFSKQTACSADGAFSIDPDIPIPLEIPDDCSLQKNDLQAYLANLNMDMIVSGMLRAIEEGQVKRKWIDYYSAFVLYMRPDILEICQTHQSGKGQAKSGKARVITSSKRSTG